MSEEEKKVEQAEKKEPREHGAIQAEYQELCKEAGHLQYLIEAHRSQLVQLNARINHINMEAVERKKLDEQSKEQAA